MQGGAIVIPKGWVFGYKLHLTSTTAGEIVVPLTAADVTTANVPDNQMYVPLTSSSSSVFSLPSVCVYGS